MTKIEVGDLVKFKIQKPYGADVNCGKTGKVVRIVDHNYCIVAWDNYAYSFHKNEIEKIS